MTAVAAAGVVLATVRFGIGLTPDSVVYVTGARSLADGAGYTGLGGGAIGAFPPGYSGVLCLFEWIGIDAIDAARWVSACSLVATVVLGYVLLRRHVTSPAVRLGGVVAVACSAVLLEVYSKALSEHLFVPVILAFIVVSERVVERRGDLRLYAVLVVLSWAAFYLRYAGIVTVAVGSLTVLGTNRPAGLGRALAHAASFAVAAVAAPLLWMARNIDATGDPMGPRADASASPFVNVKRVANELSQWVATDVAPPAVRAVALAAVGLAGIALILALARGRVAVPRGWTKAVPLALFVATYVVYLVGSASIVAFAAINTRFLVPVFVPTIVLGAWLVDELLRVPRLRRVVTVVASVWVVLGVAWFGGRAVNLALDGAGGYASERWQESELMREVPGLDLSMPTYTNESQAIALFTGRHVPTSVAKRYFQSDERRQDLDRFVGTVACAGRVQLVWFMPNGRDYLYEPNELSGRLVLDPIVERADGVVYDVRSRPGTACPGGT